MQSIRWVDHRTHMMGLVADLYRNVEVMDCKLNTRGGLVLCHKTILAACSPYLKERFKEHKGKIVIPLKEVHYSEMKLILDFIYLGEVYVPIPNIASLLRTAELLQISFLKCSLISVMNPLQQLGEKREGDHDVNPDNGEFLNEELLSSLGDRLGSVCESIDSPTFGVTEPKVTEVLETKSTGTDDIHLTNRDEEGLPSGSVPDTLVVKSEPEFDDRQGYVCCSESDLPEHHDQYPCNSEMSEAQGFSCAVKVKVENIEQTDENGDTVMTENMSFGHEIQHSSEDSATSIVKEEFAYLELSGISADLDPERKVKLEPFCFEPGFVVKEEKPFEPDLILRKIRINESLVKKEPQDDESNPAGKKKSARFSTKSTGRLRLSVKRRKPGCKKNSVRKPPKPPLIDLSVEDGHRNKDPPKKHRRLTLSMSRKKRKIPPGLVNWRIQQSMRKRAEALERAMQAEHPMEMDHPVPMEQAKELNT